jgi:hypothetical protein
MAPPTQAEKSNDYKMMAAILKELDKTGKIKGISWLSIAQELGIEKLNTLAKRWGNWKKKEGCFAGATGSGIPKVRIFLIQ